MRKKIVIIALVLSLFILSGCTKKQIDLLYSESVDNFDTFEPVTYITSFSDYTDTNYPIEVEAEFFNDNMLYTYTFLNANIGKDLFELKAYNIDNGILTLTIEDANSLASPAFGTYVMIFSIDLDIYNETTDILIEFA
jgi:hypothetical protein